MALRVITVLACCPRRLRANSWARQAPCLTRILRRSASPTSVLGCAIACAAMGRRAGSRRGSTQAEPSGRHRPAQPAGAQLLHQARGAGGRCVGCGEWHSRHHKQAPSPSSSLHHAAWSLDAAGMACVHQRRCIRFCMQNSSDRLGARSLDMASIERFAEGFWSCRVRRLCSQMRPWCRTSWRIPSPLTPTAAPGLQTGTRKRVVMPRGLRPRRTKPRVTCPVSRRVTKRSRCACGCGVCGWSALVV